MDRTDDTRGQEDWNKSHVVNLTIVNNTNYEFSYRDDYFNSGRLANNNDWPKTICPNETVKIQCYEKDGSVGTGCSGWTKYFIGGREFYFCFSNPFIGSNGIALGLHTHNWNTMTDEYENGITSAFNMNGSNDWITAHISNTGGDDNEARWELKSIDLNAVTVSNFEMQDVVTAFKSIPTVGTRQYYTCDTPPTNITGLAQSHFKGIAATLDKLIFTHSKLEVPLDSGGNGRYLVADKITIGSTGSTELTAETGHPTWLHPCSSQACGSFMAMGIQESVKNPSKTSEIEIYDIRPVQVNQPIKLLGKISRSDDGVNGVGMTRDTNGYYLVAGIDGNRLKIYRSTTTDLLASAPTFEEVMYEPNFPESGPGIALITQTNGDIYAVTLNADDDGSDPRMGLFKLDLQTKSYSTIVAKVTMPIPGLSDSINNMILSLAFISTMPPPYGPMG